MLVNGEDFTPGLIAHGGNDVIMEAAKDRKLSYDCKQVDYFLAWKVSGEVGKFIKETHGISDMLLYANYNRDAKSYLYFAKEWIPWQNAEVTIYDKKTTQLPDWINLDKLNNFEDKPMTTAHELNVINTTSSNEDQKATASMGADQQEAKEKTVAVTENATNEDKTNHSNNQDMVKATENIIEEKKEILATSTEQPDANHAPIAATENATKEAKTNHSNNQDTAAVIKDEVKTEAKEETRTDTAQLEAKEKADFLDSSDTITAMKDGKYNRSQLEPFDLPKIKALTSYSVIKAINNKIYTADQLFKYDAQKIRLLTSEDAVRTITSKVYTAEQLLSYEMEKIQILISDPVLNSLKNKIYTTEQLLNCNIEKIQALTAPHVTSAIKDKVFTADQLLGCDPEKIRALTSKQALDTIRPEKSKIDTVKEKAANVADKLGVADKLNNLKDKVWGGAKETKTENESKDTDLYTAKELIACDTRKILALTDEVSQALIANKIYSIEQMLKFDITQLEAFIAKARAYEHPESAVVNLGKVYFFALNGAQLPLRELLEKEKLPANNEDKFESPLAVTVHAGFGPNAHLLVEHKGHFNHHDFVMDAKYVKELIEYIPNILSKQEQQMAFTGFAKHTDNCVQTFEDWCLVESTPATPSHGEL